MEDYGAIIAKLKSEIKHRDRDIHLSATYGKQLLDENSKLQSKIDQIFSEKELLKQEKHSLLLEFETLTKSVQSLTTEADFQRDKADSLSENFENVRKEKESLLHKLKNIQNENKFIKDAQESLTEKNKELIDHIAVLEAELKHFHDQTEKSLCESKLVDDQELQAKLNDYIDKNKALEEALTTARCELEVAKKAENSLLQKIKNLEEDISDRDKEIAGYSAEIRKTKEEIGELQAEIELLKFDQVNTNKRGNSVFAELDDRRTVVEQEFKLLQKKYKIFMEKFEENKKELDKTRSQIAILQSLASREYQQTYIDKLETDLSSAKNEIAELTYKLAKAPKNFEFSCSIQKNKKGDEYKYLKAMLMESQKNKEEMEQEIVNLRMKCMYENDRTIEAQQLLYKAKQDIDRHLQEISVLKLQMNEIFLNSPLNKEPPVEEKKKPNIEIIENFKPVVKHDKPLAVSDLSPRLYIPGELELFDDGFRQVKPSRKSSRFVLQEFNQMKEDEGTSNVEKESSDQPSKISQTGHVGQAVTPVCMKTSKSSTSASRKYDNCAQQ